jgi:homoserine dehydrogenase
MMAEVLRVGIAGLGTVGAGVVRLLQENRDIVASRAGRSIEVTAVSARDRSRDRGCNLDGLDWVDNAADLARRDDCDVIAELIGGEDGPARALVEAALDAKKPVVTANKALLAHHGPALAAKAESAGVPLAYEAAVAGGIPVIKALREGLAANKVDAVFGILNGTCNYILSEMQKTGRSFVDVLDDAQKEGYAESDPTLDVDGIDAAHKLSILTGIAFGVRPDLETMRVSGIRRITATDIEYAQELGYVIKLLGISRRADDCCTGCIVQMVEPCLVPQSCALGGVDGVFNAVQVENNMAGQSVFVGRGAGAGPTSSAVVADIIDIARGIQPPCYGVPAAELAAPVWADIGKLRDRFYLRLNVVDKPGVLADISSLLRDHGISIEALLQHGRDPGQPVMLVMTTHEARQSDIASACEALSALPVILESPCVLRIEELDTGRATC